MSLATLYNFDPVNPTAIVRELHSSVGTGENILGDVKRGFKGGTDFEIWDSAAGGTQLVEDTDYELLSLDSEYSRKAGFDVYTGYKILNPAYQAVNIYISYKIVGSYIDADTINGIISDIESNAEKFIGIPLPYFSEIVPSWALELDGSAVSRTTYSTLFALYGVTCGNGDGSTTFNLPDMRGETIRGWDHGAGNDPDAATRTDRGDGTTGDHVLTKQGDALKKITGSFKAYFANIDVTSGAFSDSGSRSTAANGTSATVNDLISFDSSDSVGSDHSSDNESRSRNVAWMYIIAHGE